MAEKKLIQKKQKHADITLLLEGTYPFIRGGVSGWVHQLIEGLPQYTFALVFLGSKEKDYTDQKYAVPSNVVHLECHYLWDPLSFSKPKACNGNDEYIQSSSKLHDWFRNPCSSFDEALVSKILVSLGQPSGFTVEEFFYSVAAWEQICKQYNENNADNSFIDYIWAIKSMHAPLFKIANIAHQFALSTGTFHTVSTGFAGLLGVLLHYLTHRPLILTEHGIYTKERKIDLQSLFIKEHRDLLSDAYHMGMQYQELLWLRYFESLGRLIYKASNPIISLYEKNRERQITDGADRNRTKVIPNGMEIERFLTLRAQRPEKIPLVIGLLGRIVPIKDIKTFIRAMRTVVTQLPEAEGWLIGPDDEDKEYAQECRDLVLELELEKNVHFLGFQKISDVLPRLGLLVLSSISEAFPLVLLEAYASGLPVVTTDVGCCREIIEGSSDEDRALGCAGIVVPIANPEAIAEAIITLLTDENRWYSAQRAGIQRVESYYTQSRMLDGYKTIYDQALTQ
ncbi:GT4 family glycosyltransferase PelF [Nitrosomonas communis]|uniref:Glycosyltransferase involved in cell wall bisynthesis n=1 Tax=Nitrosomonas communis TaxID=44574 RepID=A0A1H2VU39_9PROT|nr:GT4 family glycosyltransferase PelF [Nitrosomonas communis]SDW71865.1 Glycosyltransferase involved in cell wall bisynthesis [Nitrosomonas communis]